MKNFLLPTGRWVMTLQVPLHGMSFDEALRSAKYADLGEQINLPNNAFSLMHDAEQEGLETLEIQLMRLDADDVHLHDVADTADSLYGTYGKHIGAWLDTHDPQDEAVLVLLWVVTEGALGVLSADKLANLETALANSDILMCVVPENDEN